MTHDVDQHINALLRGELIKVVAKGEDDTDAPVHAPEEEAHSVFCGFWESPIPQKHFPVEGPAFGPEDCAVNTPMSVVTRGHEILQVVPRNELVVNCRC